MAQSRLVLGAGVEHLASIGSRARRCIPRARSLRAVTALAVLATAAPAVGAPRPNVLLVVVDRLRADHLGAYGYGRATSPRLDALAASGVRFAQARATSSWTAPSVAAILTGLYPLRHGLQLPSTSLQPTTPVLAESFAAAGYATAALSANAAYVTSRQGFARGFDEFRVLHGGGRHATSRTPM